MISTIDEVMGMFKELTDFIGQLQVVRSILGVIAVVCIFAVAIFLFTKKVNKESKGQIERFIVEKKYIPEAFVELNNNLETLRYFVYSKKWKRRIVKKYNSLFKGLFSNELKDAICSEEIRFSIRRSESLSKIEKTLNITNAFFDSLKKDSRGQYDKYGEYYFILRNAAYYYCDEINKLLEYCRLMKSNSVVVVGSAGNGKTNIVCRLTELITNNKMPCIFINSRDIENSGYDYLMEKLHIPRFINKHSEVFIKLLGLSLWFKRQYLYVLIDAINENDRTAFVDSIKIIQNFASKNKRFKILYTCRSEYFEYRYEKLFTAQCENPPYIFTMHSEDYSARSAEKLFNVYGSIFEVNICFSELLKHKLLRSLFLMRIFFEVNSKKDESSLEFRNAEIYKKYFEKIASENIDMDLNALVSNIAKKMFESFDFDAVKIEDAGISRDIYPHFIKLTDNSLIVSKTVKKGDGITERYDEYVYFVFDEFRDFCLARYLLTKDEEDDDENYHNLFENLSKLYSERLSPIEGVIKYSYHHFKTQNRVDLCERLLSEYGASSVQHIVDRKNWSPHKKRAFSNFGCSLIFMYNEHIQEFEHNYLSDLIANRPEELWRIVFYLFRNEYYTLMPDVELAVDMLCEIESEDVFDKIMSEMFYRDVDMFSNQSSALDIFCDFLERYEDKWGNLSQNIVNLIVLMAAYDSSHSLFYQYGDYITDKTNIDVLVAKIKCKKVKEKVDAMYKLKTMEIENVQDIFSQLFATLEEVEEDDC